MVSARIAVTGASGTLGRKIHGALHELSGIEVVAVSRSGQDGSAMQLDLADARATRQALAGCDWVVHAAGKTDASEDLAQNVAMARSLAGLDAGVGLVNLSSLAVYGRQPNRVVDESAPCRPVGAYGRSKLDAEVILDAAPSTVCHLRIGTVWAPGTLADRVGTPLRRFLKGREVSNLVLAGDVAAVVRFLIARGRHSLPRAVNVVRPGLGDVTYRDLLARNGRSVFAPAAPCSVPHALRRLRGRPSIIADRVHSTRLLHDLGFEFSDPVPAMEAVEGAPTDLDSLRILHGVESVDVRGSTGLATRTLDTARELRARGASVTVVSLGRRAVRSSSDIVLPRIGSRFFIPRPGFWQLRAVVRDCDVVHLMGHWNPLNLVLAHHASRLGVPYVVCPAGSLRIWGRSVRLKRLFNVVAGTRFVQGASGWVAVVSDEIADFEDYGIGPERVTVIPNGARPDMPRPRDGWRRARQDGTPVDSRYVMFLGRLDPIKGADLLVAAYCEVAKDVDIDLVMAGPDTAGMRHQLEATVARHGLTDRVSFPGFVDGEEKHALIAGSIGLVIASRREAMSVVVLEAAAWRRPVVATTRCGLGDLLDGGGGLTVEPTQAGLVAGLRHLAGLGDPAEAGVLLHDAVNARFGWDGIAARYRDLYLPLVRSGRVGRSL